MRSVQSGSGDCIASSPAVAARRILAGLTLAFGACDTAPVTDNAGTTANAQATVSSMTSAITADVTWTGGEMLGQPTDHSVAVKAIASQAVETYLEVGTTPGSYTISTPPMTSPDGVVQVVADGLAASTRYVYRLRYRAAGSAEDFAARPEYTLQTQRATGATFTFAIQSDSHLGYVGFNDPTLYGITMANIAAAAPDFLLDLGDAVSTDAATETQATVRAKYANQRAYFEVPGHASSIFLVLGNHENEEGWNLDDFGADVASSLPVLGANARKMYFLNPIPNAFYSGNSDPLASLDGDHLRGDYYAFTWGDALFVAIDPYWYTMTKPYAGATGGEKNDEVVGTRWDWTLGQQQYAWLKQTLENSHASFKFVFTHQMAGGIEDYGRGGALGAKYCEWGGSNLDGTAGFSTKRAGWASPVHALMVQNHVTAFFHGHDHVYAKETLDGVVYQEVPMAANANYDTGFGTNATEYAGATMIANSGFLRVSVAPTAATVDYVRSFLPTDGTNGSVAASYVMAGCTADTDGDGSHDCTDGCPSDRAKVAPGACGCGVVDPPAGGACPAGAGGAGGQGGGAGGAGGAGGLAGAGGADAGGGPGGLGGFGGFGISVRGRQMGPGGTSGFAGRRGTGRGGNAGGNGGAGTGGAPGLGGSAGSEPGGRAGTMTMGGGPAGPPTSMGGNGGLAGSTGAAGSGGAAGAVGGPAGAASGSAGSGFGGVAGHLGTAGAAGTPPGLYRGPPAAGTTTSSGGGCDCMAAGAAGVPSETSWAAALVGAAMIALGRRRPRRRRR